jgi:fatty acid desaturase
MNFHLEHHMFPMVPYHALHRLHDAIKADCPPAYDGVIRTYAEIIPALVRQATDPSWHVERVVPPTRTSAS